MPSRPCCSATPTAGPRFRAVASEASNRRSRRFPRDAATALIGIVTSVIAAGASFVFALSAPEEPRPRISPTGPASEGLLQRVNAVDGELEILREQVDALTSIPQDAAVAAQIGRIDQSLSDAIGRLSRLEEAILADPAKALQVPLLSNQVSGLEERTEAALVAQRESTDRVYDLLKVSILALAIGVLALAVPNALRARKEWSS